MKVVDMHCDTILRLYDEGGCLSKNDFNIDFSRSTEIIYTEWQKRSIMARTAQSLAQLFSAVM